MSDDVDNLESAECGFGLEPVKPCFWKLTIDDLNDEDKKSCRSGLSVKFPDGKRDETLSVWLNQGKSFSWALRKGDFVCVCENGLAVRLVQIEDNENLDAETNERKCSVGQDAVENGVSVPGDKQWMPKARTVFVRVPDSEIDEFERLVLKPCFNCQASLLQKERGVARRFWWLNANKSAWQAAFNKSLKDFREGEEPSYTVADVRMRNQEKAFYGCREGDVVVGYSTRDKLAYSLLQCSWHWAPYRCTLQGRVYNPNEVYFKIWQRFEHPIPFEKLRQDGFLDGNEAWNSEYERFNQTSLAQLKGKSEEAFMSLVNRVDVPVSNQDVDRREVGARNLVYFGAPGTGKSFAIDEAYRKALWSSKERVTFHPDYSYANFVGAYKPCMEGNAIVYKFVPGPFTRVLVNALRDPNGKHLLVIEEINRANTAAVFGDVFQLLDRNPDGESEYAISPSQDLAKFLREALKEPKPSEETPGNGDREDDWWWLTTDLTTDAKALKERIRELRIPANMYLWATMNSADQGVFPMDTAFKRRWSFKYVGIDEGQVALDGWGPKDAAGKTLGSKWNDLRRGINKRLLDLKVNEDKCMGPFFLGKDSLVDVDVFLDCFKSKVLMYLFEDAARQKRGKVFADGLNTLAGIFNAVEGHENVFDDTDLNKALENIAGQNRDNP